MKNCCVVILAGGQSSRMGRDKALIAIEGVPLLRRVCDAAMMCSDRVFVVTSRIEQYRSILPTTVQFFSETDLQGPLVAFAQAITQLEQIEAEGNTDWILLLACDLPNLSGEVLRSWAEWLPTVEENAIALLPQHEKGWEPLCGFYRRRCLSDLRSFVEKGGRSFQRWLASQQVQPLKVENAAMLLNCNTPDELPE